MVGYYYPIDQQLNWAVEPLFIEKTSFSDMQYHLNAKVIYQDFMWLGLSYRQFDSFVILLGADYGQYFFGYKGYDASVSNISNYNSGSHEIIIGYNFNISRKRDNTRLKKRFEDRRNLLNPFKEYKRL